MILGWVTGMVFKKPYAFLIKHFRLIHIVLTILTIVAAVESYRILSFFADYINNNYSATIMENMVETYIGNVIYAVIIAIIVLLLIITFLLKQKNKPTKTYIYSIIFYIIFIIFVGLASSLISGLTKEVWSAASAKAYRDIATIIYYPQFIAIVLLGIRAIGFDVKKFNFKDDLRELEITEADSEEIELNINFDSTKTKRNVHRFVRETGYYYQENKFILTLIAIIGVLAIGYTIYKNYEKNIFKYNEGDYFNLRGVDVSILSSMITDVNTKGDPVRNGSAFLVLLVKVENNTNRDLEFCYDYLRLLFGNNATYPDLSLSSYFSDYGDQINGARINSRRQQTYILPYEINKEDINSNFKINVYLGDATKKKKFVAKQAYIKLKPQMAMGNSKAALVRVGTEVDLSNSTLGNAKFSVSNPIFTTRYVYKYDRCFENVCDQKTDVIVSDATYLNRQALIILDYKLVLDEESPSFKKINTIGAFAKSFIKIEYGDDYNHMVSTTVNYATPSNLKDKLVLQTVGGVLQARKVSLIISIRNRIYSISIKDN